VAALALPLAAVLVAAPVLAQEPAPGPPQTRAEAIADERSAKVAELWPQRQSPMVDRMNALVERGLQEGLASGRGANGAQLIFGGMRSGQGFSGGIGYRRSDLWQERLGYRVTARATPSMAHMLDLDLDFQGLRTEKTSLRWYTKYEHSPNIDYYGFGNESSKENLTGYLYDDFTTDFSATWEPVRLLRLGLTGGYLFAHTEEGSEELPPIGEVFPPNQLPGYGEDTQYTRIGLFAFVDSRDAPAGPRSGLLLGARYREYWDVDRKTFAFRQSEFEFQQYFPYFNRSRVVALRAAAILSFHKGDNDVPLYLQPTLGGNDELRGYERYRFRDSHSLFLGAEHRWHLSSVLDMAVFADGGKVVPLKREVNFDALHYSGGLGVRVRLGSAVVTRIDFAHSSEGFRWMWTFSDVYFTPRW
jgi:outer membrane protein assembly factor BamA